MKDIASQKTHQLQKKVALPRCMYNWTCTKCGSKVNQMNQPIATSCPKGGYHNWTK